jgi:nucleoside-diphosphate-sugar epimerase
MRILVIGGNRFFGKRLVNKLLENGDEVTLLNRKFNPFGSQVQHIMADRSNPSVLESALKQGAWDVIYDQVCYTAEDTRNACRILAPRAPLYIFTSSKSVYDYGKDIKESVFNPNTHEFSKDADRDKEYAEAKRQCETIFTKHITSKLISVRFPIVVGPDDYTERFKFHVDHIQNQKPIYFPNIDAKMTAIHAQDASDFLFSLRTSKHRGPVNASSKDPIVLRHLISLLEKRIEKKALLAKSESEGDHSPYGIQNDWYMNIDLAQSLGFTPLPVEDIFMDSYDKMSTKNEFQPIPY